MFESKNAFLSQPASHVMQHSNRNAQGFEHQVHGSHAVTLLMLIGSEDHREDLGINLAQCGLHVGTELPWKKSYNQ